MNSESVLIKIPEHAQVSWTEGFFCASEGDCEQHVLSTYEPLLSTISTEIKA